MEAAIRATPGALAAVAGLARSSFGPAFFAALGRQMLERQRADGLSAAAPSAPAEPQALLDAIAAQPQNYALFGALRAIECAFRDMPRLGESKRPRDEPIRIGQPPSLAFPAAAVASLEPASEQHPPRLMQHVLGLFGPNGPLPLHLTEFAFERGLHHGDETVARFADIFHHRLLSLFYRAWANSQPAVSLDRTESDHFGTYIGALCGLGMPALRKRDAVDDFTKLAHAGIFGRQVKCAEGLQIVLANHFNVPVTLAQWLGHWLPIPASERTRLGRKTGFATLGEDAVLGERVWDCQGKFRLILGPLSLANYQRFLPNGKSYAKLRDLVKLYIGVELDWDLQLALKKEEVPRSSLGSSVLLGWTWWLGTRMEDRHAEDLIIA